MSESHRGNPTTRAARVMVSPSHPRIPARAAVGRMIVIETFERGCTPRHQPTQRIRIDSS